VFPSLFFTFQVWALMQTNLGPFIITVVFKLRILVTVGGGVGGV